MPQALVGMPARTPAMAPSSSWAGRMARQRRRRSPGAGASGRPADAKPATVAGASEAASGRPAGAPTLASRAGTSGRPRAADGRSTPSRSAIVAASSSTERGSRLVVPGTAPSPQTTNGTGLSPQSRWPWPPIPRPWPWSAISTTVAPSSLPRSSRKARNSPTRRSVSASCSRYSAFRTPRTWPSWSAARSWSTRRSGSSSSTTRRASADSEWSIRPVGWTEVTELTTSSPNGSSRWAIPTRRPRRPWRSSTSKIVSLRTPKRATKFERIPCSAGVAPVSIDEKQTTVRAG